jgi:hypothetical protein
MSPLLSWCCRETSSPALCPKQPIVDRINFVLIEASLGLLRVLLLQHMDFSIYTVRRGKVDPIEPVYPCFPPPIYTSPCLISASLWSPHEPHLQRFKPLPQRQRRAPLIWTCCSDRNRASRRYPQHDYRISLRAHRSQRSPYETRCDYPK